MASASEGNRLVFKPSPLGAPRAASAAPPVPAHAGHGERDDVTLFVPGSLDGMSVPLLDAVSLPAAQAEAPPRSSISAPEDKAAGGRLWLYWTLAAAVAVILLLGVV